MSLIIMTGLVALGGGLGAGARFLLDTGIRRHETRIPAGTMLINVTGSLLVGLLAGLVAAGLPDAAQKIAGTGFLGGYTTFSTACVEVAGMIRGGRMGVAFAHGFGMLVLGTAAAAGGWIAGQAI